MNKPSNLELTNFGFFSLQDDLIAWPSGLWKNHVFDGTRREAKPFSQGA